MNIRVLAGASQAVIAFIMTVSPLSASQTGMNRAIECGREHKPGTTIINSGSEKHYNGIWACRNRRAAVPISKAAAQPPAPPEDDYKLGYMFTPAYLSSPQVAVPALSGPGSSTSYVNPR
jgi:hypothetical protein